MISCSGVLSGRRLLLNKPTVTTHNTKHTTTTRQKRRKSAQNHLKRTSHTTKNMTTHTACLISTKLLRYVRYCTQKMKGKSLCSSVLFCNIHNYTLCLTLYCHRWLSQKIMSFLLHNNYVNVFTEAHRRHSSQQVRRLQNIRFSAVHVRCWVRLSRTIGKH